VGVAYRGAQGQGRKIREYAPVGLPFMNAPSRGARFSGGLRTPSRQKMSGRRDSGTTYSSHFKRASLCEAKESVEASNRPRESSSYIEGT
jgi:hypothetical protein